MPFLNFLQSCIAQPVYEVGAILVSNHMFSWVRNTTKAFPTQKKITKIFWSPSYPPFFNFVQLRISQPVHEVDMQLCTSTFSLVRNTREEFTTPKKKFLLAIWPPLVRITRRRIYNSEKLKRNSYGRHLGCHLASHFVKFTYIYI